MPNQYVNKVVKSNGETIIDLSQDTVTSSDHIMSGYVGHLADGSQVTGTGQGGGQENAYEVILGENAQGLWVPTVNYSALVTIRNEIPIVYSIHDEYYAVSNDGFSSNAFHYSVSYIDQEGNASFVRIKSYTFDANGVTEDYSDLGYFTDDANTVASDVPTGKIFYTSTGRTVGTAAGGTPAISVVDTIDAAGGTVRTITALDISDTTAIASDVATGKYFYTAQGVKTQGTASGGTPSQTQHSIYFKFSDNTNATITAYWDDSFISSAIIATTPTTYGSKTVDLAQLDGVTWYERAAETWETLYDGRKTANADTPYNYFWLDSLSDVYPTVGSTWKVTIDGTSYTCTAYSLFISGVGNNVVCFGNPKYSGGTDDGSSIPANFYNAGWGALVGDTELSAVEHAIKIERLVTS